MPKITILGSCKYEPYEVLAVPNKIPNAWNTEEGYQIASQKFYPAIDKSDVVVVWCPSAVIGEHTLRDVWYAINSNKRVVFITDTKVEELFRCPHCKGKGVVEFTNYPASGAEIDTAQCGVCHGIRFVSNLIKVE